MIKAVAVAVHGSTINDFRDAFDDLWMKEGVATSDVVEVSVTEGPEPILLFRVRVDE